MKNLNNPPLIRATFKIWWHLYSIDDIEQSQYILGDFFGEIKNHFPNRNVLGRVMSLQNIGTNMLITEFKKSKDDDGIVIELTNESLDLICTGQNYKWEDFKTEIQSVTKKISKVLKELIDPDHLHISLEYLNFVEEEDKEDILNYLSNNLNFNVDQKFYDQKSGPYKYDFSLGYKHTENCKILIHISNGEYQNQNGIVIKYKTDSGKESNSISHIIDWADMSHSLCETIFFKMHENILDKYS